MSLRKSLSCMMIVFLLLLVIGLNNSGVIDAKKKVMLTFEHHITEKPERALFFERAVEKYQKLHPEVTIDITKSTFQEVNKTILTAMSAGKPFDIFSTVGGPGETRIWLEKNAIMDLTKYFDAKNGDWKSYFREGVMDSITYVDGKIYYVPLYVDSTPMNYHKEIFKKYNVPAPKNKTDFFELCEKFKNEGFIPFQLHTSMKDDFLVTVSMQFAAKYNLKPFDIAFGKVPFTGPWFKESLAFFKEMYDKGYLPQNFWSISGTEGRMAYSTGKMPMKFGFYWDVDTHYQMGMPYENQGVASLPNFTGKDGIKLYKPLTYTGFLVSKQCKNPDVAADFLKFLTNQENQDDLAYKYFGKYPNGMPVVNKNIKLSEYAQSYLEDNASGIGTCFTPYQLSLKFDEVVSAQIPLLMQGKVTVDEVAAEFDKLRN